jgi:3-hydroxybutyryl-CoA dehydrogenase
LEGGKITKIRKVAVIGAGRLGLGITQVVAGAGLNVIVRSRKERKSRSTFRLNIEKVIQKQVLSKEQADLLFSNVEFTSSLIKSVNDVDLVIEAVVEDLSVKMEYFKKIDAFSPSYSILASNTSSLSIDKLAKSTQRPEKVIGMHFFNPAPIMKLVEVAPSSSTSKDTIDVIVDFANFLGKVPIIVKDTPGFITNRILIPMINEASFILMENGGTPEIIDQAMKLGANFRMGPLALADLIGIDTCLKIMEEFNKLDKKYVPCPLFREMIRKGHLGRKTGKGFYKY